MMNNNKILTVSYGTFSCTLEGFEDSFDTMKAIAEYFRDLAADDRYFGAEPPQPDVEMLARIAEREVARRVEAHQSDTGIHLRTQQAGAAAVTAVTAVTAGVAATALSPQHTDAPVAEAPGVAPTPTSTEGVEAPTEDVAEAAPTPVQNGPLPTPPVDMPVPPVSNTLAEPAETEPTVQPVEITAEIEAPVETVSEDKAPMAAETTAADLSDNGDAEYETEGEDETVQAITAAISEPDADDVSSDDDIMAASMAHPMASMVADVPTPPTNAPHVERQEDVAEAELESLEEPEPNSIADKLARIREVVAKNQSFPSGYSEDQHADEFMKSASDDDAEEDISFDEILDDAAVEDVQLDEDETAATVAAFAQTWDELEEDMADEAESELQAIPETGLSDDDDLADPEALTEILSDGTDEEDDLTAEIMRLSEEFEQDDTTDELLPEDMEDEDEDEETFETQGEIAEQLTLDDEDFAGLLDDGLSVDSDADEAIDDALASDADESEPAEANVRRVRVIKVKRDDVESVLAETTQDDHMDEDDLEPTGSLTSSEEEDLLRELEQVEAELEAETSAQAQPEVDQDMDAPTLTADDMDADASAARLLQEAAGAEEAELDRLMAEADSQMDEPESTSRRSAFSHLRAAVQATKADDKLSEEAGSPKDDEYRTDLAAAVKPRRPVARPEARKDRPRNERPAPLKLVAEQRIDAAAPNAAPVRPRRVSAEMPSSNEEADSFADYAEACGAHELSDVLEAAASYLSFVEGKEQFSRPQLMTKVRQLGLEGFTREDGLRHFGQLLRAGKIEKIKGGRFTVSEDIGFRPDDHRQAG